MYRDGRSLGALNLRPTSPGISGYLGFVDGLLHVRYICIDLTYLYV